MRTFSFLVLEIWVFLLWSVRTEVIVVNILLKKLEKETALKEEQIAIAEVLATADHEIDLLQKNIEQEKEKKKALMQLLLTGIVRVKT